MDLLPYFTVGGIAVAMTVGMLQIKESLKKRSQEQQEAIKSMITSSDTNIISHIDDKLKVVEEKFKVTDKSLADNKEDIEDVEDDMKRMVAEFKAMCEKVSKHDYVIEDVLPDFKSLKKEFYNFKSAVDNQLYSRNGLVTTKEDTVKGSDEGNAENITRSIKNGDEIQE